MSTTLENNNIITVECGESSHVCDLLKPGIRFLLSESLLYCCTTNSKGIPHITPVAYAYEMDKCQINFLIDKKSVKARNLRQNPFVSLTADFTHKSDPLQNSGIMVTTFAELNESWDEIVECLERLYRRYASHLKPELIETFASQNDLLVQASIIKLIYWRGPFFKRNICPTRSKIFRI